MSTILAGYFNGIKFGELQQFEEMAVLPVFTKNAENIEYLTLKEAISQNLIEITELDNSGVVPEVKVNNHADMPVLLLDGEELLGAKQNRIVNTTILLKENCETIIPVSCVEQGRWSNTSNRFEYSDRIASYQLRNVKSASVKRSVENLGSYNSDQIAVWDEVNKLQNKTAVHSPTMAMGDIFDAKAYDLDSYIETFDLVEGQRGILVFINGEIMGLDIISSMDANKILHKKLIKSYALDAMVQKDNKRKNTVKDVNIEMAHEFIDEIVESEETKNQSVGYGYDHRFSSDSYIGSALVLEEEVVHASFFKNIEVNRDIVEGMASSTMRANLRQS